MPTRQIITAAIPYMAFIFLMVISIIVFRSSEKVLNGIKLTVLHTVVMTVSALLKSYVDRFLGIDHDPHVGGIFRLVESYNAVYDSILRHSVDGKGMVLKDCNVGVLSHFQ